MSDVLSHTLSRFSVSNGRRVNLISLTLPSLECNLLVRTFLSLGEILLTYKCEYKICRLVEVLRVIIMIPTLPN